VLPFQKKRHGLMVIVLMGMSRFVVLKPQIEQKEVGFAVYEAS
jgi:hypothetical protein